MNAAPVNRIENKVEWAASLSLAGAVAFAVFSVAAPVLGTPGAVASAAVVGALACLLSVGALRSLAPRPRYPVPVFDLRKIDPAPMDELLLTDDQRVKDEPPGGDALLLDDILAELGPDSRVVRLFDPSAMPTPGQLKARIDRHLDDNAPPTASPDASQALLDALSELRSSLR
jgi:hypothetical protein